MILNFFKDVNIWDAFVYVIRLAILTFQNLTNLKMSQHRPLLLFIFGLFNPTSLQFFEHIYVTKCPSSILCRDSNPWPSEHESPPITTRPGLTPSKSYLLSFDQQLSICSYLYLCLFSRYNVPKSHPFCRTSKTIFYLQSP